MSGFRFKVTINGSDKNPWHVYGLRYNPFPQHGKAEFARLDRVLQDLDSDPIRSLEELDARLAPHLSGETNESTEQFVQMVRSHYRPGERVSFELRING